MNAGNVNTQIFLCWVVFNVTVITRSMDMKQKLAQSSASSLSKNMNYALIIFPQRNSKDVAIFKNMCLMLVRLNNFRP